MAKVIFEFTEEKYSVHPDGDGAAVNSQTGVSIYAEDLSPGHRLNLPDLYVQTLMQNAGAVIEALHKTVNQRMKKSGFSVGDNQIIKRGTH